MLAGCSPSAKAADQSTQADQGDENDIAYDAPVTSELAVPEEAPPDTTDYDVDVLVVGCGFTGMNAAFAAAQAGKRVLVAEKGYPGYGGMSAWAEGTAEFGQNTDKDKLLKKMMQANEYLCNLNWVEVWCEENPAYMKRMEEWGFFQGYPSVAEAGCWVDGYFDGSDGHDDLRGYIQSSDVSSKERRPLFANVVKDAGAQLLDHTMICDVVENDGKIAGAVGFHLPSGTPITAKAAAVILCSGTGVVRSNTMPVGGGSYDATYIGYRHGLPIANMEFEAYQLAWDIKPGSNLSTKSMAYLQTLGKNQVDVTAETADDDLWGNGFQQRIVFDPCVQGVSNPEWTVPDEGRAGSWKLPGAAPGMPLHMTGGVFNGLDETLGETTLPGLYVAGDGPNASAIGGACYSGITGLTSSGCSIQGFRAGKAAAEYVDAATPVDLPADKANEIVEDILAPLSVEKGYHPNWVNQQLLNVMSNPACLYLKNEDSLKAALTQVEFIRDKYLPKVRAASSHDLKLCREIRHKVLASEIKLRLGLERKESRGMHYRIDYPYRNDDFLGYFTATKSGDAMDIGFVEVEDEWKGDLSADYATRYPGYHFDGEAEALGIEFPVAQSGGPGGPGGGGIGS